MSKITTATATAQKWFEQGLTEHGNTRVQIQAIKERALLAGWYFAQAKAALPHGEWLPFLEQQTGISDRTVRNYMEFAVDAIATVIGEQRKLTDDQLKAYEPTPREMADRKLLDAAKHVVIHSSQGFMQLTRELGMFRKLGEYDAVKHAAANARQVKAGGPIQLSFDLGIAMAGLRSLSAINTAQMEALPHGKLPELRDKLKEALDKVEARLGELKATMEADVVV
jgi:hypothetical protein